MLSLEIILIEIAKLEQLRDQPHTFDPAAVQAEIDEWHDEMAIVLGFEPAVIVDYTPTKENR